MRDPRYPVGKFRKPASLTADQRAAFIAEIEALPARFDEAFRGLTGAQLDTPYRDGGWTIRQVAHHAPDSHLNAYVRMKFAATEESPAVRAYDENAWSALPDASGPIGMSLDLLRALHVRWVAFLRGLPDGAWNRPYVHSANGPTPLFASLASYAWHGRHHLAHVTELKKAKGW